MSISCLPGREDGFLTHRGAKAGVGGGGGGGGGSGRLGPEPRFQFPVTLPGIANLLPSSGSPWDNIGSHHRNSLDLLHSSKGGMVENIASPTAYLNRDALALQARSPVRPRKMATSPETQKEAQPLDFSTKRRKLSLATDAEDCISEDGFLNAKEDTEPPRKSPASSSKLSELDIFRGSISSSRLESSRATALTHMGIGSPLSQYTNTPLSSLQAPPPPPPPPHRASPMCMAPGVNSALLAHLQANPLLLSTLQSALATSRLAGQYEPYLPSPRHTPSPANFSIPSSTHHSTLSSPNLLGINPLEASGLGSRILGMESTMEERGMKTDGLGNFLGLSACSTNPLANLNPLVGLRGLSSGVGGLRDLVDTPNNIMTPTQAEAVINAESNESYIKFRRQMLVQVSSSKGRKSQNPQSGNHEDDSRSSSDLQCESFSNRHSEKSPGFSDAENNNSVEMDVGTAGSSGMLMDRNLSDDGDSRMSGSSDINVKDCSSNPDTTDNDCSINSRSVVNNPSENSNSSNSSNRNTAVISHLNSSSHQTTDNDSNRASTSQSAENVVKDEAYWERRRKNNEAAKRSRDARRAKEDEIAIRAAFLEQENIKLRVELSSLKSETTKLRCLLYNN